MDDKMKAAFLAWHDSVTYIGPEDIVEWTLDYLRSQQEPAGEVHPDDAAVDAFAVAMKEKLAAARAKGRGGWNSDEPGMQQRLSDMLRDHVEKGDPRDVANFCMFLHQRGESILPQPAEQRGQPKRRPYNASGSLSEYGVFPECDAQQPAEGEEIMVNTPYDVFTLPLQPSGLSSGPRFVVHVPGPEQPSAVVPEAWITPGGDVSRSFHWCLERCLPDQQPRPLYAAPQQPAVHPATTHCDNCGCDWLDNGLNPVGCPYCKQNAWRAAFVAERAVRYCEGGMAIEQARIHAETGATLMEHAARQQPAAVDEGSQ